MKQAVRKIILGIDTGGTFTDGVAADGETGTILAKAKADTTRQDLSIGIAACIDKLTAQELNGEISLVCLSTTLATNTVVEGQRSRVGLISSNSGDLRAHFQVEKWAKVSGEIDITGDITRPLDKREIEREVKAMKGKVDAFVVSGYSSVRNPIHEREIKEIAQTYLDVPVICAHELSGSLGFNERTATAVLNAHLLPVVDDLLKKTRVTLSQKGIHAPITIMRGDGTMMSERQAAERPVEMVLSGPAASIVGGAALTGIKDAFIIDLGGTTMDIANLEDGRAAVSEEGATVGGWQTKVKAVDIRTFGLGGDSRLKKNGMCFSFGPERAMPVCHAAERYPYLIEELKADLDRKTSAVAGVDPTEGLILSGRNVSGSELEQKLLELLRDGPHMSIWVARYLANSEKRTGIKELLKRNVIRTISITPTDLLHASGEFRCWDENASKLWIRTLAEREGMPPEDLIAKLAEQFRQQMCFALVKSAFSFEGRYDENKVDDEWLFNAMFGASGNTCLKILPGKKVVALGAPAAAWLTRLDAEVILPEHAEVASAAGAARGVVDEVIEVLIRYDARSGSYRIYLPWEMRKAESFEAARTCAEDQIRKYVSDSEWEAYQGSGVQISEEVKESPSAGEEQVYEARLTAIVSGRPDCLA